eukprot:4055810-Lingulodinium_polyedra.AAC.2
MARSRPYLATRKGLAHFDAGIPEAGWPLPMYSSSAFKGLRKESRGGPRVGGCESPRVGGCEGG